ncbi:MAG: hypothetical protein JSV17_01615 [Candidatus Aminicenantes bacterium]|nr:MAG: hypothetical protein JSV17_01615 [Candidatus Aminicenantes bacterium]
MKFRKTFVVGVLVLILVLGMTGCFVLSVHPLYFEKDLVFESGLVGTWGEENHEKDLSELWIFEKLGDKSYRLIIRDSEEEGMFEAHLLKLGEYMFLDLYPEEPETSSEFYNMHVIPAHSFMRISLEGHVLRLAFFDLDWLKKNIEANAVFIKHERRDDTIVLTASTEELQEFVLKHIDEAFEFEDASLHRFW